MQGNPAKFSYTFIFIVGFSAICAQIIVSRELISIFHGNELSTGITLGSWLIWTAIGSKLFYKLARTRHITINTIAGLQIIFSFLAPFSLAAIRFIRQILSISPGEVAGLNLIIIATFITLAPFCLISGFCYSGACLISNKNNNNSSKPVSKVYFYESIGSGIGGIITSLILIRYFDSSIIIIFLFVINLLTAALILIKDKYKKNIFILPAIFSIIFFTLFATPMFRSYLLKAPWKGHTLIGAYNSVYGKITITRLGNQYNFFQNGVLLFSVPDKLTEEESVHYAMLSHKHPEKVLIIGGSPYGLIHEVLLHPSVIKVTYVNLDPALTKSALNISEKLPEAISVRNNPKVKIVYADARKFIRTDRHMYDVIITALPSPYNAQLNRFYTVNFYREVKERLSQGGLFSTGVPSSENAISPEQSEYLSMLHKTLKAQFKSVFVIPGETCFFIAFSDTVNESLNASLFIKRIKARKLKTRFVREYYIPYQLSKERVSYLKANILPGKILHLNMDFRPVGYYFDTILWATTFAPEAKSIFKAIKDMPFIYSVLIIIALSLLLLLYTKNSQKGYPSIYSGVNYSISVVGFSEISLEIIAIISFQVIYGYAFYALSIIIAGYMIGLAAGSRIAIIFLRNKKILSMFITTQLIMFIFPLGFAALLMFFQHFSGLYGIIPLVFPIMTGLCGFIGGFQFPLATQILTNNGIRPEFASTSLYSRDLAGSAAGAILISAFFVPVYGIYYSLLFLSILNAAGIIIIMLSKKTLLSQFNNNHS